MKSKYVKHSILYWIFEILRWFSIIAPFIALGIKNKDKYFVQFNGTKFTIGAILLVGIAIWAVLKEAKKKQGKNVVASPLMGIIYWGIAYALVYCFSAILNDLQMIIFAGLLGQCCGFIFGVLSEHQNEIRKAYMTAEINTKVAAETFGVKPTPTQRRKKVPYE